VTLYVPDCDCCERLNDVPQPVSVSTKTKSNIHLALRDLPASPNQNRGSGETRATSNPEGAGINRPLLVALTVIFVLCGALPDSVEGAKLQPQPLGSPEQANERDARNPFSGLTETIKDPDTPGDMLRLAAGECKSVVGGSAWSRGWSRCRSRGWSRGPRSSRNGHRNGVGSRR